MKIGAPTGSLVEAPKVSDGIALLVYSVRQISSILAGALGIQQP